jgi:hypothetical protein
VTPSDPRSVPHVDGAAPVEGIVAALCRDDLSFAERAGAWARLPLDVRADCVLLKLSGFSEPDQIVYAVSVPSFFDETDSDRTRLTDRPTRRARDTELCGFSALRTSRERSRIAIVTRSSTKEL